jgi:pyruvate/2-oxoglutarate dehydrogenase complex dihydrolipoamide dehydrogenase (E3) component
MPQSEQFDVLILGSGAAGKRMAWHMAGSGRRTAIVERRWVGGAYPNIACMPSKNEIRSAEVAHLARHAAQFGAMTGPVKVDMATVRRRKRDMVEAQIATHLQNYKKSGAELIMGTGRFVAPKTVEVSLNDGGTRTLAGGQVFLDVGTHAAIPSVPGLEAAKPLTHIEVLELDYLPANLIVIGGGYTGLELAQAYRRFGSEVTIVESGPQLMGREDFDVSHEMQRVLEDEGIQVHVAAELFRVRGKSGEEVSLDVRTGSGEQNIGGSDILVAAGRVPNTAGIGLGEVGIELDSRGYIRVNERLDTSAPGRLGPRRMRRQPAVHPHIRGRLSHRSRQSGWRAAKHARSARPVLHVYRSAARACRIERRRSGVSRRHHAGLQAADESGAAGAGNRPNRRFHEGSRRRGRRPHSRLHHDWRRGR